MGHGLNEIINPSKENSHPEIWRKLSLSTNPKKDTEDKELSLLKNRSDLLSIDIINKQSTLGWLWGVNRGLLMTQLKCSPSLRTLHRVGDLTL